MGLHELQPGMRGKIKGILPETKDELRLYEMGLVPGEEIEVLRQAPWGGLLLVRIMGYELCLRKDCAASIMISETK